MFPIKIFSESLLIDYILRGDFASFEGDFRPVSGMAFDDFVRIKGLFSVVFVDKFYFCRQNKLEILYISPAIVLQVTVEPK
jgi:hypothetical protein